METVTQHYKTKTILGEYRSLDEFYKYICETPLNDVFRWAECSSTKTTTTKWTGTSNFDEATDLFKHGWATEAVKLEQRLKLACKETQASTTKRAKFDVVGFQASVPRYLQGIPTSMVNQKTILQKQKVITLNKSVSYGGYVSADAIKENSVKALHIVKKLEAEGYRVNLNIILGTMDKNYNTEEIVLKIRIKNAGERLNISKVAFPLCHPSMLRRLLFRYIEVNTAVTHKGFIRGYGSPIQDDILSQLAPNEYLLPKMIDNIDAVIKSMNLK